MFQTLNNIYIPKREPHVPFAGGSSRDPPLQGRVVQSANRASDGRKSGPQEKRCFNAELTVSKSETLLAEAEICFTHGSKNPP